MPYGLSVMTGVLPTIVVAGTATKMVQSVFNQRPQPARRKKKRVRRPSTGLFGNFSNVGF